MIENFRKFRGLKCYSTHTKNVLHIKGGIKFIFKVYNNIKNKFCFEKKFFQLFIILNKLDITYYHKKNIIFLFY